MSEEKEIMIVGNGEEAKKARSVIFPYICALSATNAWPTYNDPPFKMSKGSTPNKHNRHQGSQEKARRLRQMEKSRAKP